MAIYALPANRSVDWTPGTYVGVLGGIPTRTNIKPVTGLDTTGATDVKAAIMTAWNSAVAGDVVLLPSGILRVDSQIAIGYRKNVTLRGQNTIIRPTGNSPAFHVGGDSDYSWNTPDLPITTDLAKGETVIPLSSTAAFNVGNIVQFSILNSSNALLPVISVMGFPRVRRQKSRVIAKTATTITIFPPLHYAMPAMLQPLLSRTQNVAEYVGIEDLNIDLSRTTAAFGSKMSQSWCCWLKNVTITDCANRHFFMTNVLNCEMRECDFRRRQTDGSNGAGFLFQASANCLIEDNIITNIAPCIQLNDGVSGSVIAYNFIHDPILTGTLGSGITTNHGPHNSFNLIEGNCAPNERDDGYFGGSSEQTYFRNWFHGTGSGGKLGFTTSFNRFTRSLSLIANQIGRTGLRPGYPYSMGNPNLGNSSHTGTAQPSVGDWWADYGTPVVSGLPGPNGWQELDLDVEFTGLFVMNWNALNNGIPAGEVSADTMPSSFFRSSKPAFFGSKTWPPFDPLTPNESFTAIPAGERYAGSVVADTSLDLAALSITNGTLSPVFAPSTTGYTSSVLNSVTSTQVSLTLADGTSSATVNGNAVASGGTSGVIALSIGSNTITLVVTNAALDTRTYTLTVIRAASSISTLSNIIPSTGTLSPSFISSTLNYNVAVPNVTSSITVRPFTSISTATIKVNGTTVASGSSSGSISLAVGSNIITIVCTAQDGTTTSTYRVTVSRAGSSNADLLSLVPSAGTFAPPFSASLLSYMQSVGNSTTTFRVTPTVADSTATVTVNGVSTASGTQSAVIALAVGSNAIAVIVTAQDGTTTKAYTLTVTRGPAISTDATLSALTVSVGTLSPAFASATLLYASNVIAGTPHIYVRATANQGLAIIRVNGVVVASGALSGAIGLSDGANAIDVEVTAQDWVTIRTYRITVNRAYSANADLAGLALSIGTLAPAFLGSLTSYTASVPNSAPSTTVIPTLADSVASLTVDGTPVASGDESDPIMLNVGANTITIEVTAADTITTKTYTVIVTRAAAQSSNADLAALDVNAGTLSPAFTPSETDYTATVANATAAIIITPEAADDAATVAVNGVLIDAGDSATVSLSVGDNLITVSVLAEDATVKGYTLTVTRSEAVTPTPHVPPGQKKKRTRIYIAGKTYQLLE